MNKQTKDRSNVKKNINKNPTQARNWCFTDFKNSSEELQNIFDSYHPECIRFMCWGVETCPTTNKIHMQGFVQFTTKRRLKGVQKFFGHPLHCESIKGHITDNTNYCSKAGHYTECGKYIVQGQRTDLEMIQREIIDGANLDNIMDNHFQKYCQYRNGIRDYVDACQRRNVPEWRELDVEVVYGETGVGKTRSCVEECTKNNVPYFKIEGDQLDWFDGYNDEKVLIIDEYDSQIKLTRLLNILDGYRLRLPIKGSFSWANWTKVYITSNISPNDWHQNAKDVHKKALMRRITKVTHKVGKCADMPPGNTIPKGSGGMFKLTLDF